MTASILYGSGFAVNLKIPIDKSILIWYTLITENTAVCIERGIAMEIIVNNGTITDKEKNAYIEHVKAKAPDRELVYLEINLDGEFVDLKYKFAEIPFERIRRVTGYLTGTLDRWNDAKRAEEADRVKHAY